MKIQRIELRGFKSIREVILPKGDGAQTLGNLVILIGRNSCGKTNLLEALHCFFQEFDPAFERAIGAPNPELWHGRETTTPIEWIVTLKLSTNEIETVLGKDFEVLFENVDNKDEVKIIRRITAVPDMRWQTIGLTLMDVDLIKEGKAVTPEEIAKALKSARPNSGQTELPQVLKPVPPNLVQNVLSNISGLLRSQFRYINAARDNVQAAPSFGNRASLINSTTLSAITNLAQGTGADVRKKWEPLREKMENTLPNRERVDSKGGQLFLRNDPLTAAGGGAQSVLAVIHEVEAAPAIVAVEEPENHLHPELVKKTLRYFQTVAEGTKAKQLFVATHSPFFVDSSYVRGTVALYWDGQETKAQEIGTKEELKCALFDIGARPSDIFFSDLVLIVEGESDRIVLQNWARKLGFPLEEIHAAVIPARGINKTRYHLKLWTEVANDVGLPKYAFVDKDGENEIQKVVNDNLISQESTYVLERGSIEDYYNPDVLINALQTLFKVTATKDDLPVGERVKAINKLLKKGAEEWKVPLAEEVSKNTEKRQIYREIADFIRRIYSENSK